MKLYTFDLENGDIVAQVRAENLDQAKAQIVGDVEYDSFYSDDTI